MSLIFARFRTRLLLLLLLAVVPLVGLVLYGNLEQRRIEKARVREGAIAIARLAAAKQENVIRDARQLLGTLTQFPFLLLSTDRPFSETHLANLRKLSPDYGNFGLIETNGILFCSAGASNNLVNLADRSYFRRVLETRKFSAGDFQVSRVTGEPSINFGQPVIDDQGRLQRVLYAGVKLSRVSEALGDIGLPPGGIVMVIDRKGNVLARQPQPQEWIGQSLNDTPVAQRILSQKEGVFEMPGLDGVPRLHAVTAISDGQVDILFVSVEFPLSASFARANQALGRNLFILGLVAILVLAAGRYYARRFFIRPVYALGVAAQRLAEGDLAARTGSVEGAEELVQLGRAFDDMAGRLQKRQAEIEQANERIKEQAAFLDKAQDAILVCNMDGLIQYWNQSATRLYGWNSEEALGKNVRDLIFKDSEQLRAANQNVLQNGEWSGQLQQRTKAGEEVVVESRWTLVRDEKGHPKCILTIDTDITDRKKLEEQFLRSQRMESLGALAGGIAHDLNNALVPVLMGSELLRESDNDKTQQGQLLELITTSAQRCTQMVKQILTFARGSRGPAGPVPLRHLIDEVARIATDTFPKSITIRKRVPKDLWNVQGDGTEMHQVLMNLCVNARDAMSKGGQLTFSAENVMLSAEVTQAHLGSRPGPHVVLSVADTGTGIPPELKARIFEAFFTTKAPDKGTGLGLSTVANIVKRQHGFIEVQSELGKGSEFKLFLPAVEGAQSSEAKAAEKTMPVGHGELILVVDDETCVLELAKTTLENYGYKVLTAPNGLEGIASFEMRRADIRLVVTDTDMPFMDGMNTIRAIQKLEPAIPIILASGTRGDTEHFSRIDATHIIVLPKPYGVEQLLDGVAKALTGSAKH